VQTKPADSNYLLLYANGRKGTSNKDISTQAIEAGRKKERIG